MQMGNAPRPHDKPDVAWAGRSLGKYRIAELIGIGGMGVVYKAQDSILERYVALKILPEELASDKTMLQRFLEEAKAAAKLVHPNAVTIHEVAQENQTHYIAMELVNGGSAGDHLEQHGAYSVLEATRIAADACQGLAAAHDVGLVHRDIKPANLLRTSDGKVKIADFGLAKNVVRKTQQLTQADQVVGTAYFMSPEQCESRPVDRRSDVYSLGATYYSLITGVNPYDGRSVVQVMFAHCHANVPDPRSVKPQIPVSCATIIARAMAKNPVDRYQTAEEMLADLNALTAGLSGSSEIDLPSQSDPNRRPIPHAQSPGPERSAKLSSPHVQGAESGIPKRRVPVWLGAGLAALVASLLMIAVFLYLRNPGSPPDGKRDESKASLDTQTGVPISTGPPIKVGILHSLTGTMASSGAAVVDATLLAIEELNDAGGAMGRPIEAVVADGRSDPAVFAQEAERLITRDRVSTVFGCWTSSGRKTVVPIFERYDHLLVYPLQYEGLEQSPSVIYTGAAPNQQIIPAVKWAYAFQNKRRFFLVGSDYVFPRTANEIIKDTLKELGAELVGEEYLLFGSADVDGIIARIQKSNPDVILNTINGDSNVPFFRALRSARIHPDTISTISFSIGEEELRHLDVADMADDFAAWNYFQSLDSPENKQFLNRFRAKYGPQRVVTDPMEAAYFGVKLWAQAVEASGSDQAAEIRRAMRNQRMRAPHGDVRVDPESQHTYKTPRIGRIQSDGQFEVIWTAAHPEPPMPYPKSRTTEQWKGLLHDLFTGWGEQWAAPAHLPAN
jgi:urea transport system substrate-binding protein